MTAAIATAIVAATEKATSDRGILELPLGLDFDIAVCLACRYPMLLSLKQGSTLPFNLGLELVS